MTYGEEGVLAAAELICFQVKNDHTATEKKIYELSSCNQTILNIYVVTPMVNDADPRSQFLPLGCLHHSS